MNNTMIIEKKAYAKINLTLDVLGTREDGYHLVDMLMQTVELCDDVIIELDDSSAITLQITDLRNEGKSSDIPSDERNLMYRAALLIKEKYAVNNGIAMTLIKRIPSEAGLAGGSTDAAAVLTGLNELIGLNISESKLMELGAMLGADIPYCIAGGTARAQGTGTDITRLRSLTEAAFPQYVLMLKPKSGGSTKKIYASYDRVYAELGESIKHPYTERVAEAVNDNSEELAEIFRLNNINVLEHAAREDFDLMAKNAAAYDDAAVDALQDDSVKAIPEIEMNAIEYIKQSLMDAGAFTSSMTGSGSVIYGLFHDEEQLVSAENRLKQDRLLRKLETFFIRTRLV